MEYSDSDSSISNTPPELQELAKKASLDLLPQKSRTLYEKQYKLFMEFCQQHNVNNITENVFLAYFSSKCQNWKSSTLWSVYSMLKSTMAVKNNIDISKFAKLHAYLKKQHVGYRARKSKIFNRQEINSFLQDAPNDTHLMWKVCLITGIAGACRRDELRKLKTNDIVDQGNLLIITIPDSKNGKKRVFTITDELCEGVSPLTLFRQYKALSPSHCEHNVFFVNYRLGKCSTQVVGVHTFAKIPSLIAKYLNLPNESAYTGHCYRRTSATLLVNAGADILSLKNHGGWKSSTVAEGYVEDSISNKIDVSKSILTGKPLRHLSNETSAISDTANTTADCALIRNIEKQHLSLASSSTAGININNCNNCTISVNLKD